MRINKKVSVAIVGLLVAIGAVVALNVTSTDAQALGTTNQRRDCTDEDIIYCGALTQTELLQDYDANKGDVQAIFSYFGINRTDLAGTTSEMKMGILKTNGTIVVDGKTVATNAQSTYRIRTKAEATTFVVNGKTYYKLPVNGVYWKDADVFVMFKNGKFFNAVQTSCGNIITATPVTPPAPQPQPVYSCDRLTANKITRTRFSFTTAATAKDGAEIVNYTYDFGDGVKQTAGKTVDHTYVKPGSYTVKVVVNVKVNGVVKAVPGANCQVTVKVEAVPVTPLYACNSLTARIVSTKENTYAYTLSYTAQNGATLSKVTYNFGDSTSRTYAAANATNVQHTYAKPGSYKTTATLYFNVNGKEEVVNNTRCEVAINIKENVKPEVCEVPGKQHLPKNSPLCVEETPVTPTELPKTGVGSLVSGAFGLSSVVAAGYYWVNSRRNVLDALLNR